MLFSYLNSLRTIGEPKSVIDLENQKIMLRQSSYPKNGSCEFVVFDDTLEHNCYKLRGVVTKIFHISQVSRIDLEMSAHHSGCLTVYGEIPQLWARAVTFNGADVFAAHAVYTYIVAKRQDDRHSPLRAKISPLVVEIKRQLDEGEFSEETLEGMRRHNVSFLEPKPRTIPITPAQEAFVPQPASSFSVADELLKLKNLVDAGVISPIEFENEKRRLLGN